MWSPELLALFSISSVSVKLAKCIRTEEDPQLYTVEKKVVLKNV